MYQNFAPYIEIVSQCILMSQNAAPYIEIVSQCIEIHFDKPSNFLYLWNAFGGKLNNSTISKWALKSTLINSQTH